MNSNSRDSQLLSTYFPQTWDKALSMITKDATWERLMQSVASSYKETTVFPPASSLFRAFNACSFEDTKVVILGQDPYHSVSSSNLGASMPAHAGIATGLAFSVDKEEKVPPSLRNIIKEGKRDIGPSFLESSERSGAINQGGGILSHWADQGVLLLNTALSVKAHSPKSHSRLGWDFLVDRVLRALAAKRDGVIFVLWGNDAKAWGNRSIRATCEGGIVNSQVDSQVDPRVDLQVNSRADSQLNSNPLSYKASKTCEYYILEAGHPSPLSVRYFSGCSHFSKINKILEDIGESPILW